MAALGLNYMGTKKALAPHIATVISAAKSGPVLDAFSGMCAVGQAVGSKRQIWSNDIQTFAATVARTLFVFPDHPPRSSVVPHITFAYFERNQQELERRFARLLEVEREALNKKSFRDLAAVTRKCRNLFALPSFARDLPDLQSVPRAYPYRLFSYYYAGTYLGLQQCIDIDSLVYAVHQLVSDRRLTRGQAAWLQISLGVAIQKVATTTGHFAQYLEIKKESAARYMRQRSRSIWEEWLSAIPMESPLGDWEWREGNRVFRMDTLALLRSLGRQKNSVRPAVVYADPPYTSDHYSRYYHLLETLVRYDYPRIEAKARYRTSRFSTPFSIKTKAKAAFERLASTTAGLGADLVVSYPKEGLLSEIGATPLQILRSHFRKADICRRITHDHSTHGASKGPASKEVTEIIYWARP